MITQKNLEEFDIEQISSLFHNFKMQKDQDMSVHNSMIMFNNTNMDNLMQNKRSNKKTNSNMLAEHSMFTTVYVDQETQLNMFVKLKKFKTATDGQFTLVIMEEVDIYHKVITGRYIIVKLTEQKDYDQEDTLKK